MAVYNICYRSVLELALRLTVIQWLQKIYISDGVKYEKDNSSAIKTQCLEFEKARANNTMVEVLYFLSLHTSILFKIVSFDNP